MRAGIVLIDKIRGTDILRKYSDLFSKGEISLLHKKSITLRIADLLNNLKEYNAYYKPLLSGFTTAQINENPLDVLSCLPMMNKQIINDNYSKIYSPIEGRPTQLKKTGGSTGNPFYYHVDKEHLSWFWAYIYYFWNRFSGYKPGDPFITIAGNSLRTTNKRIAETIYHKLQNNYFIKGDVIDKNIVINFTKTNKAALLYGYPSSIINMINTKPELLKNVNNLKAIFTTSEQLTPQVRKSIEEDQKVNTSKRAAIEGTNSALKRCGANDIRVRTLIKTRMVVGLKVTSRNIRHGVAHYQELQSYD